MLQCMVVGHAPATMSSLTPSVQTLPMVRSGPHRFTSSSSHPSRTWLLGQARLHDVHNSYYYKLTRLALHWPLHVAPTEPLRHLQENAENPFRCQMCSETGALHAWKCTGVQVHGL